MDPGDGDRGGPEGHRLSATCPMGFVDSLRHGGKHRAGFALARTFARLAEKGRDPEGLLFGERLVGILHHFLGEQTVALRRLESMLNRAGPLGNPADILRFQFDQSVVAGAFLVKVLWLRGLPDAAIRAVDRSVVDAQSIGHSLSLCYALGQGAGPIALLVGDLTAAEHYVALLLDHSTRHGLALGRPWIDVFKA
jgi:hypothetical protein